MDRIAPREPRRPEGTVPHRIVRENLASFVDHARLAYERPLPRYVVDEFHRYLRCGIAAHGFVRLQCQVCGDQSIVALSCKNRGLCPSCSARRMANTAAQLVDRVLPAVPIRQWVLSLPFEIRRLAAFRADVLAAIARIFAEVIFGWLRKRMKRPRAPCGSVAFTHRFGGSLNLNVHMHLLVLDGVFDGSELHDLVFRRARAPFQEEIADVANRTRDRVLRWLRRKGLIEDPQTRCESSNSWSEQEAIDACARIASWSGGLSDIEDGDTGASGSVDDGDEKRFRPRQSDRWSANADGFNVHAGVRVAASEDEARERLCRYGARPALALGRLSMLPDGMIAYRVKHPQGPHSTHRIMQPLEFMARLAALIPPPRYPLVRYAGVLAPNSPYRRSVVPRPPEAVKTCRHGGPRHTPKSDGSVTGSDRDASATSAFHSTRLASAAMTLKRDADPEPVAAARDTDVTYNRIGARHWARLEDGALLATSPRLDWALLFRRTYLADPLRCRRCQGRMRPVEIVTDEDIARDMLERLGMTSVVPEVAPVREPTEMTTGPPGDEPQLCFDDVQTMPDYEGPK